MHAGRFRNVAEQEPLRETIVKKLTRPHEPRWRLILGKSTTLRHLGEHAPYEFLHRDMRYIVGASKLTVQPCRQPHRITNTDVNGVIDNRSNRRRPTQFAL